MAKRNKETMISSILEIRGLIGDVLSKENFTDELEKVKGSYNFRKELYANIVYSDSRETLMGYTVGRELSSAFDYIRKIFEERKSLSSLDYRIYELTNIALGLYKIPYMVEGDYYIIGKYDITRVKNYKSGAIITTGRRGDLYPEDFYNEEIRVLDTEKVKKVIKLREDISEAEDIIEEACLIVGGRELLSLDEITESGLSELIVKRKKDKDKLSKANSILTKLKEDLVKAEEDLLSI